LFLSSWDRLRVQTRRAVRDRSLGDRSYRFVTFLAAGDALATLDQAGPGLGLEISGDGLRRLARVLDPERSGDPIAVSDAPDPELRTLFGFEDPTAADLAAPPASSPPTTTAPTTTVPPTTLPLSWLWSPGAAEAATVDLAAIGRRLDRWVPRDDELTAYRDAVDQMLTTIAAHRERRVAERLAPIYRNLVPAVAWQESCWRQFVEQGGVTFLLSATGDVGIMQVNRRVWRGFFDVRKLEWDALYNAAAGAEILVQLLGRFGAAEGATVVENAARATYSAYNAGPAAHRRYRSAKASPLGRAIDRDFYAKFRLVAAGTAGDRVLCM
ncbi:MAG: transglycosylase SLT domain-containing protein, partial [Candidatus Binatia bacterium]